MSDMDLASIMKNFIEQMEARHTAIEEQKANLSRVQRANKHSRKNNSRDAGNRMTTKMMRHKQLANRGGVISRYSNMKFPPYNGIGNPFWWMRHYDKFYLNQIIGEGDKVGLAAFY